MRRQVCRCTTRSGRVRAVYLELQQVADGVASKIELLKAAADLVKLLDPVDPDASQFGLRTGGLPFDQWELDRAMADGGWRVLYLETDVVHALYDDERDAVSGRVEVEHWMMENAA